MDVELGEGGIGGEVVRGERYVGEGRGGSAEACARQVVEAGVCEGGGGEGGEDGMGEDVLRVAAGDVVEEAERVQLGRTIKKPGQNGLA